VSKETLQHYKEYEQTKASPNISAQIQESKYRLNLPHKLKYLMACPV